jgi:peptidoglycan/xylan/chitin deacetylase (PgdA/CDA1 family)
MSRLKTLLKSACHAAYLYSGAAWMQEWAARLAGRQSMAVLLLHRVTDQVPEDPLTISTARFRAFCELLCRDFHVVELAEVFDILRSGRAMPPRTVALTFDDCYRDNIFAARDLAKHHLPATFFVPTGFVGTDRVFPWDRHLPQLANLTWDDLQEMILLGHEIGSHTVNHIDLGKASAEELRYELVESKAVLEKLLGRRVRWLAYPFGGKDHFGPQAAAVAKEAGYQGWLSGHGGFIHPGCDPWLMPRDAAPCYQNLLNLRLHLRGCLDWIYSMKRRLRGAHDPGSCLPECQQLREMRQCPLETTPAGTGWSDVGDLGAS